MLAVLAAISMMLSVMLLFADPAGADGNGTSNQCKTGEVAAGTAISQTYAADDGEVVAGVCIKSGVSIGHTEVLGNGLHENGCYSVSGVGTQSVTVELVGDPSPDCQDISHVDVLTTEPVDECPEVSALTGDHQDECEPVDECPEVSALTGDHQDECEPVDECPEVSALTGDHQDECEPVDECPEVSALTGDHQDECEPVDECPEVSALTGDHQDECEPVDECPEVSALTGEHQDECEPVDECPEVSALTGEHQDECEPVDECPEVSALTGDHQDECEPVDECPEVSALTGDHQDECEPVDECPEVSALTGDHQDDEDCDSEECPEVPVQNGGDDANEDEDCATTTTTTTTTMPSIAPEELELTAIGAVCFNDIPYLSYAIDFPGGQSATITFLNPNGADIVYEDQPLSGAVLWPGASESPPDWPGWILEDGVWVAADDGFLWARGNISVLFEVNPSTVLTVSYPQTTEACADPENVPDVVGGVVITPPTTPTQIDGVEVLPFTGVPGGALAAVAFAALSLGGLMVLSARKDEAEES